MYMKQSVQLCSPCTCLYLKVLIDSMTTVKNGYLSFAKKNVCIYSTC